MYRVGKRNRAHAHGTYIKPMYLDVWKAAQDVATQRNASLSELANYAMFVMMTGREPSDSPLTGRTPFSEGRVLNIDDFKRRRVKQQTRFRLPKAR